LKYAIVNNNGVYIRLNNGQPVACPKKIRDTFSKQKAENILEHLPKSMRRLHFKLVRTNRKNRRNLKDEMVIIHNVIAEVDTTKVSKERTQKAIDGLFNRKYTYRIIEVNETENK
jgi:hypothetical protein